MMRSDLSVVSYNSGISVTRGDISDYIQNTWLMNRDLSVLKRSIPLRIESRSNQFTRTPGGIFLNS